MPAGFPVDVRKGAVERFLGGMPAREVCDWALGQCGRRPSEHTISKWVAATRRGCSLDGRRGGHSADTIAGVVARRLTSSMPLLEIAAEFGVSETVPIVWVRRYFPDKDEQDHVASLGFDAVFEATMKRVSKDRKVKRATEQRRIDTNREQSRPPRPVDSWLPGPGPVKDIDALPDDVAALKQMLVQQRERDAVKDAIIEVLMGGGDTPGKDDVRDGVLTTAAKAAVVGALTELHGFSIARACALIGIATSTFYYHRGKHAVTVQDRARRREELKVLILQAVEQSRRSYGYRRIHAWLQAMGHTVSEKIVRNLMAELGCRPPAKQSTKHSSYTGETDHTPQNLLLITPTSNSNGNGAEGDAEGGVDGGGMPQVALSQYFTEHAAAKGLTHDFHADAPWEKIGTDVTEIHCADGKLFLSAAIDFYDGMPIAVTMSTSPDHDLVAEMIARIDECKPEGATPIIHSDRGGLYRSPRWVSMITHHTHDTLACSVCQQELFCPSRWRYIPSLSRKGNSGDNARVEGFFGTMKQEILHGRPEVKTMTVAQMRDYIDSYIDFYINTRLKSTLGEGYTTIAEHRKALSA